MKKILFVFLTFLLSVTFTCQPQDKEDENIIAQVNDAYITKDDLERRVPEDTEEELKIALMRQFMEQWVEEEILYQTALSEDVKFSEKQRKLIQDYERRLLIQLFIEEKINKPYRILDKEIEDFYNQNKDEFVWDEDHAHLIYLIIDNRDNKIFAEIRKSNNLMDIIKSYFFEMQSTPTRPNGDLGYVKVKDLPEKIIQKIKYMRTGSISQPVKMEDGYHFVQLLDFQKAGNQQNIEIVRDEIILRLKIIHRKQELANLKNNLRTNFKIQTDISKLAKY
jgi:parvulin-like peptidyl-prolyl isomerase